jgi:endonuclease/exonuclease/phosphatase (EEP) superfamily protein YafD
MTSEDVHAAPGPEENSSVSKDSNPDSSLKRSLTTVAGLLVIAVTLTTVATSLARHFWLADLMANLRMQQVIAISFSMLCCLLARQFRLACVATTCLAIHLFQMGPQLVPDHDRQPTGQSTIRIMTVNVLTKNRSHNKVIDEIRSVDPDIVAIVELSSSLQNFIEQRMAHQYPYVAARSQDEGNFGIGLYSKYPIDHVDVFQLNESINSIEVVCEGLRIIATHPLPPMGARLFRSRNEHLRRLAARIQKSRKEFPNTPIVALGDFNLTPWSPVFDDWENGSGLRRARRGLAIRPTWYARGSLFPFGLILDHVFLDQKLRCLEYRVGWEIGSDHRSVSVTVGSAEVDIQ